MISLQDVRYAYGSTEMRFQLEVTQGDFMIVIGPSGAGKSTLLNLIAGFEAPQSGSILLDGRDAAELRPAQRPVTTLFQEHNLFAHLTVAENVGLGRSPRLKLSAEDRSDVAVALDQVGLTGLEKRVPQALSGGERQRVALARSLVRRKSILLLDEPFAALGPAQRRHMAGLVDQLRKRHGLTVLMVTHQLEEVAGMGISACFIENGSVGAIGTVQEFVEAPPASGIAAYLGA